MKTKPTMMMKAHLSALLCIFASMMTPALFAGCLGKSASSKPIYYYTLEYELPAVQLKHQLPSALRIERFSVSPPFHTQRIIYADDGPKRNTYAYHQWIAPPGELLPYFLVRDLRKTNGFKAVLTPDAVLAATHSLHGWVEEFLEKDHASGWQASATIHISLVNNLNPDPAQKIMLQKRYHATAPCKAKTPSALAEGMSRVMANISMNVAKDIHNRLSSAETLKY